jgi:hypothetical protein
MSRFRETFIPAHQVALLPPLTQHDEGMKRDRRSLAATASLRRERYANQEQRTDSA